MQNTMQFTTQKTMDRVPTNYVKQELSNTYLTHEWNFSHEVSPPSGLLTSQKVNIAVISHVHGILKVVYLIHANHIWHIFCEQTVYILHKYEFFII